MAGLGNFYLGTQNGVRTAFTQDTLGNADAGSITDANVDGTMYSGNSNGTSFLNSPGFSNALGLGKIGLGVLSAIQGMKNYKLAKDELAFNKDMAMKNYEANRTKYNNAVARTEAVNKFFGSKDVAKKI